MNKTFVILLAIAMTVVLIGCQATPSNPIVIGKGDGQLEEKIVSQTSGVLPSDLPESGTRIMGTYPHDNLNITIEVDALVDTQDGKSMPAVKVTPHKFAQGEVDEVYDYYVGDAHFFQVPEDEMWEFKVQLRIAEIQKKIELAQQRGDEESVERLQEMLTNALQDSVSAKEASEFAAMSHVVCKQNLAYGGIYGGELTEGVHGYFEKGDAAYLFSVGNDDAGLHSRMSLQRLREGDEDEHLYEEMYISEISYLDEGESLGEISYDDALAVAEETVSAFGAQGMALAHAEAKQYPENTVEGYYTFIFTHEVNGVPCIYNATGIANDEGYSDIWEYEQLIVKVDAHGVMWAVWRSPCDITEKLAESTAMIPFEDVMNCFSKMVFVKNSYLESELDMSVTIPNDDSASYGDSTADSQWTVESLNVYINRITLGLMRVQSGDEYLLIPVWDFFGYREALTADGEDVHKLAWENSNANMHGAYTIAETCLLTINAIDGSVIDLELGY